MEKSAQILIGMAFLLAAGLTFLVFYRWWQQKRVYLVEAWVKHYLSGRYAELPSQLHINCSDDRRFPVLVSFKAPDTGLQHCMQFDCGRPQHAWSLTSEKDVER